MTIIITVLVYPARITIESQKMGVLHIFTLSPCTYTFCTHFLFYTNDIWWIFSSRWNLRTTEISFLRDAAINCFLVAWRGFSEIAREVDAHRIPAAPQSIYFVPPEYTPTGKRNSPFPLSLCGVFWELRQTHPRV